jgi:4-oxalocrotonate tautomerase
MPYVNIKIVEGRSAEAKKALAADITDAVVKHCGGAPDHVYVVFEDIPATDWIVGKQTVAERRKARGEG